MSKRIAVGDTVSRKPDKKYETHEIMLYCRKIFRWDDDANRMIRIVRTANATKIGETAGTKYPNGRILVRVRSRPYLRSRVVFAMAHGHWPENTIDHIDLNPSNDRISNLRDATQSEQMQNRRLRKSITGFYGVRVATNGKFYARVAVNGKTHNFGTFTDAEMAHVVALHWKGVLHRFNPSQQNKRSKTKRGTK